MKIFKQATILTTLLASLIFLNSANQAQANIFNRFREGFYFEKYKTAEEAKAELLKLHPIGSDVQPLIETLERAGANVKEEDFDGYKKFYTEEWKKEGRQKTYSYRYDGASPFFRFFNRLIWSGFIGIDSDGNITSIGSSKRYDY
jgi:hypothetical protein